MRGYAHSLHSCRDLDRRSIKGRIYMEHGSACTVFGVCDLFSEFAFDVELGCSGSRNAGALMHR